MRLAQDLFSRKVHATKELLHLTAYLMKHKPKSILRPRTTSEGQKWMISKREHPCLVLFSLEIMFANTISSKYLCHIGVQCQVDLERPLLGIEHEEKRSKVFSSTFGGGALLLDGFL